MTTAAVQGRDVAIRALTLDDAPEVYRAVDESRLHAAPWIPELAAVPSVAAVCMWIDASNSARAQGQAFHFAIVQASRDQLLGGCGLTHLNEPHRFANLYYWVRSSRLGQGVAPTATRALAEWGFTVLKLQRIEIVVAVENEASLRVAAKAGAQREGILRKRLWINHRSHDAVMFSLIPGNVRATMSSDQSVDAPAD